MKRKTQQLTTTQPEKCKAHLHYMLFHQKWIRGGEKLEIIGGEHPLDLPSGLTCPSVCIILWISTQPKTIFFSYLRLQIWDDKLHSRSLFYFTNNTFCTTGSVAQGLFLATSLSLSVLLPQQGLELYWQAIPGSECVWKWWIGDNGQQSSTRSLSLGMTQNVLLDNRDQLLRHRASCWLAGISRLWMWFYWDVQIPNRCWSRRELFHSRTIVFSNVVFTFLLTVFWYTFTEIRGWERR